MELQDLNKLKFGDQVIYNNHVCEVYGPDEDPRYNDKATVTLWNYGLITVTLDEVEPYKE
jgi:hypothetical protein